MKSFRNSIVGSLNLPERDAPIKGSVITTTESITYQSKSIEGQFTPTEMETIVSEEAVDKILDRLSNLPESERDKVTKMAMEATKGHLAGKLTYVGDGYTDDTQAVKEAFKIDGVEVSAGDMVLAGIDGNGKLIPYQPDQEATNGVYQVTAAKWVDKDSIQNLSVPIPRRSEDSREALAKVEELMKPKPKEYNPLDYRMVACIPANLLLKIITGETVIANIPNGAKIINVQEDFQEETVDIMLTHESFDWVAPGQKAPAMFLITKDIEECK